MGAPHARNIQYGVILLRLDGLMMYVPPSAPADAGASLSQFAWMRELLFVTSLGRSILGGSVIGALPLELWFVVIVGLSAAGAVRWWSHGTSVERTFVILILSLLFLWTLKGGWSLYTVARYWLPAMPFALVMMGLGLAGLYERFQGSPARHAVAFTSVALLFLALTNGAVGIIVFAGKNPYFRNADRAIEQTTRYASEHIPAEARIATTDWGVMPFALARQSYQILDDPSHRLTLERMYKFQTRYLVILDDLTRFSSFARQMVREFPELFDFAFETRTADPGPVVTIYAVDLAKVESTLGMIPKNDRDTP